MRVQLGHPLGMRCPSAIPSTDDSFVVLDLTGLHEIAVDFCGCKRAPPWDVQLVRRRWFPGPTSDSTREPRTAATFRLLKHVHLISDQSLPSMSNYYEALVRLTDNTGVSVPPVSDVKSHVSAYPKRV